jgi:protein-disulfide isomerase
VRVLFAIAIGLIAAACGEGVTNKASKEEITQEQVRQYLLEHPELILDDPEIANSISRAHSQRERERAATERRSLLENHSDLLNSPLTPYTGDADSTVTLIEFYDYRCSPYIASYPELEQVKATEANVRFVYAQLPIYGSESILAARAAIAAHRQGLFEGFHAALMTSNTRLDMDSLYAMAVNAGIDVEVLRADMRDPQIIQYLEQVRMFADKLGVTGTPAYLIGDAIRRGGTTAEEFKTELGRQRAQSDDTANLVRK